MNDFEFNKEKPSIEEKLAIAVFTISFIAFNFILNMPLIAIPISLISFVIFSCIKSKWKK